MKTLFIALGFMLIASFAISIFMAKFISLLVPKDQAIDPILVQIHFTRKQWLKIAFASLLLFGFITLSAILFLSIGGTSFEAALKVSLAFAAVGIVGVWNFCYFCMLRGKALNEE